RLHGVVVEDVARVRRLLRPHGQAVVTGVADEVVTYHRVGHAGVEVQRVGDLVHHDGVGDPEVGHRAVEPQADLGVPDVEVADGRVAHRTADAVHLVGVDALTDVTLDGEPL